MKAKGGRFLLLLGAGLAALAFVVVYILMSRGQIATQDQAAAVVNAPTMRPVVVVKGNVPAFSVLDSTNLTVIEKEDGTQVPGAIESPELAYQMMTLAPMTDGQEVVLAQLTRAGFSSVLAKGEKAFSLPVKQTNTFGGGITEGDRVDILVTNLWDVNIPWRGPDGQPQYQKDVYNVTKTLLQDIKVLRVVNLVAVQPKGQGGSEGAAAETAATNSNVGRVYGSAAMYAADAPYAMELVLAVNDQQAEVIKYARENFVIDITLRSSAVQLGPDGKPLMEGGKEVRGDHEPETTTGITADELVKTYGLVPPPAQWGPANTP